LQRRMNPYPEAFAVCLIPFGRRFNTLMHSCSHSQSCHANRVHRRDRVAVMSFFAGFAGFAYAGSRSVIGSLPGHAWRGVLAIGVISGTGEFIRYGLRLFSGRLAEGPAGTGPSPSAIIWCRWLPSSLPVPRQLQRRAGRRRWRGSPNLDQVSATIPRHGSATPGTA
jgi:hypothetical protein